MSSASAEFDPYHKWLAIPKHMRPPTHYQLLGVAAGESDRDVLEEAAIRQTTHVRGYQVGPHAEACTRILNEIALARQVLTNPDKKKAYDQRFPQESRAEAEQRIATAPASPFERLEESAVSRETRRPARRAEPSDRSDDSRSTSSVSPSWIVAAVGGGIVLMGLVVMVVVLMTRHTDEPRANLEPRPKNEPQVRAVPKKIEPIVKADLPKPEPVKVAKIEAKPAVVEPTPEPPAKVLTPVDVPPAPTPPPTPAPPIKLPKKGGPLDPPAVALASAAKLVGVWTHKAPVPQYSIQQAQLTIREINGGFSIRLETAGKNQKLAGTEAANLHFENGRLAFDIPGPIPRLSGDNGLIELLPDDSLMVTYRNSKSSTTTVPMRFVRADK